MDIYTINMIEIHPNGDRRARVIHPDSGVAVWHGLGPVGEPLRLGPRAGEVRAQRLPHRATREVRVPDHDIALPANMAELLVVGLDRDHRPSLTTFAALRVPMDGVL